jgi:2-phospho-L-lactate guanylyltransferase
MIETIQDVNGRGLNAALKIAVDYAVRNGAMSLLILPADIPLIDSSDVESIIQASRDHGVVIVPSRDETGTNALMLTPPNIIPTTFGPDSFHSHIDLAESQKSSTRILKLERVGLDIDTPDHIREFLSFPADSNTKDYLLQIGLTNRIGKL